MLIYREDLGSWDFSKPAPPFLNFLKARAVTGRQAFRKFKVGDADVRKNQFLTRERYIHKLVTFLQPEGFEEPPYFGCQDLVGVHISVIDQRERGANEECLFAEYGKKFPFTLIGCRVVHPPNWQGVDEVYLLIVKVPGLNQVRAKCGLPKRPYKFHITIGIKRSSEKAA